MRHRVEGVAISRRLPVQRGLQHTGLRQPGKSSDNCSDPRRLCPPCVPVPTIPEPAWSPRCITPPAPQRWWCIGC
ncbi:hypothetical protein APY30_07295 [Xanthomonas citri pv. malvacearum]|nr:hypothetical protein APY29_14710 [Xanthomonas citri pv. malvacearum]ASN08860.1 hypothetical protein APY30_07295 [Xanthomonas citri pv. malvacearum]OOW92317.1 hypothetical protein Xmlv_13250 [Xanthomonas citri pv. malvacearum]